MGKEYVACESLGRLPGRGEPKAENQRTGVVRRDGEGTVSLKRNTREGWSSVDSQVWSCLL